MTESKERQGEKLDLEGVMKTSSRKSIFSADSAHWVADAASDRFRVLIGWKGGKFHSAKCNGTVGG